MKTEEDEAFDELAKKQGDWGGGFPAKRAMAADKLQEPVSFPCCGYTDAIKWNQFNGVVQCHMCGQVYTVAQPAQKPVAWRRREVGGLWQYFGWEETGMTYQSVERWNKNGFECEAIPAIPATPPQEKNNA